ncbi:hypothetical protein ACJRO7_008106 [Eucalyptus globulus]|uniref:Cytochrome P450 n=1 Tax=Eucalyptus globulus TaxID=34317 RepID=A0ABD3IQI5_EUCGL
MTELSNSVLVLICILFVSTALFVSFCHKRSRSHRLPPGPSRWPIFGNLFNLGKMPHRTLSGLREKYGPVIWLRLGSIDTKVILSSRVAAEFFKNHDLNFVERTITDLMQSQEYCKGSIALAPYGTYWRVSRRLLTADMLVARKCVDDMLTWIGEAASTDKVRLREGFHLARFVILMAFNLLGNLILSRDLLDPDSKVGSDIISQHGLMEWSGHVTIADLFPWLRWLGPQGLRRKMDRDMGKAMRIASDFEMFLAGAETSSSTVEWALTELLRDPNSMVKVQAELSRVVGSNRKVQETDIDQLSYLQAVVKETLRLHPPLPFLVPRKAMANTIFMGYDIPKNTQVFVNSWAIGRDPDVWEDPMAFKPERFIGSKLDYKGQHYEFIPFGAGRRMCAGVPLAHRVLHLALSSLLHEFNWEFDSRIDAKTIDMRDRVGMTMRKYVPLLVVPKRRAM